MRGGRDDRVRARLRAASRCPDRRPRRWRRWRASPAGRTASSFTAWLRMRAPVAPNGWPSAMLPPLGFMRSRGKRPSCRPSMPPCREGTSRSRARGRARRPARRTLRGFPTARCRRRSSPLRTSKPRDAVRRRHQQSFRAQVDGAHFPIDETHARHARRQLRQAGRRRDPQAGRAVGERRGVAGGQRALAARAVERRRQLGELVE